VAAVAPRAIPEPRTGRRDGPNPAATVVSRLGRRAAGPTLAVTYLSILVLLPIAAVLSQAFTGGIGQMWDEIWQPETRAAIELSLVSSLVVVVVNLVAGTAVAWLLVRDRFPLNRVIGALVDLPFALPTVVAGITLISIYGSHSPLHLDIAYTRLAVLVALAFVTLPFAVRSVQPVLAELDRETEEAAASLGAGSWTIFRRVTLPALAPALLTGAGLGFARAVGEYGSVQLFSGNRPFSTEVASVHIFNLIQNYDYPAAAAASLALFTVALVVLGIFTWLRRHVLARESST